MRYEHARYSLEDHLFSFLHHFLISYGPGLLPPSLALDTIHTVLNVGCGLGEWLLDMAFTYPALCFDGLDHSAERLNYACAYARVQSLENVRLRQGDMLQMPFAQNSYDLVYGRFLLLSVMKQHRQTLLHELVRVCAPAGCVLLLESLYPITNSAAYRLGCDLFHRALAQAAIDPDVTADTVHQLSLAGCTSVERVNTTISLSYGSPAHRLLSARAAELLHFLLPFFLHSGVIDRYQFERLTYQLQIDLAQENFLGEWPIVTYIGRK